MRYQWAGRNPANEEDVMTDTLSALVKYCEIPKPVGAILLSGEWGCGKTYLIENELSPKLEKTHKIIRISLFGITSIESLHEAVKRSWIHSCNALLDKLTRKGNKNILEGLTDILPSNTLGKIISRTVSIDLLNFIRIQNEVVGKKIVLVFDDIERTDLDIKYLLGAVNEYCENQHFHVIIVSDESKLQHMNSYHDFKEKTIQRTIYLEPDYPYIVQSVTQDISNESYRTFLQGKQEMLTALFGADQKQGSNKCNRPHNIRSLKSAIQDFEVFYYLLTEHHADDIEKWLYTYVSLSMLVRANLINRQAEYGLFEENRKIETYYPGFYNPMYMPDCIAEWVMSGKWDEKAIIKCFDDGYRYPTNNPVDIVIKERIDYLSEEVAIAGMDEAIQRAYKGELGFNDYVQFIFNAMLARSYDLHISAIDWKKIQEGIRIIIQNEQKNGSQEHQKLRFSLSNEEKYLPDEWEAYMMIMDHLDISKQQMRKNRKQYIQLMLNDPDEAIRECSNKQYTYEHSE